MSTATQLPAEQKAATGGALQVKEPSLATGYLVSTERFEHLWRVAVAFSKSSLVPDIFRGKAEDCFIAAQLALRLDVDLFMLLQNIYIVHGKPGFEAKLGIALLNASGKIKGSIRYEFSGEGAEYGCAAYVTDAHTGERITGPMISLAMVKAEKWDQPKGGMPSKWTTMAEQMYRYRSAMFLIRAHYPEVLMGMSTREELEDLVIDVGQAPQGVSSLDQLADQLESQTEEPPESDDKIPRLESQALGLISAASGVRECTAIDKEYQIQHDVTQASKDAVHDACLGRQEELRAARGPRSNKKEEPAPPTEPTGASSATIAVNYRIRLNNASSQVSRNKVWDDIQADGNLTQVDRGDLAKVYQEKLEATPAA